MKVLRWLAGWACTALVVYAVLLAFAWAWDAEAEIERSRQLSTLTDR